MDIEKENEEISKELYYNIIPKEQIERVFSGYMVDAEISDSFLGSVAIYKKISEIIPKHFTIVDCGCGYNAQSFLFKEHKKFIAVDNFPNLNVFQANDTEFYNMSIKDFINSKLKEFNIDETFAICSYVPPWGDDNIKLVRENFKNVFTYYPHEEIISKISTKK